MSIQRIKWLRVLTAFLFVCHIRPEQRAGVNTGSSNKAAAGDRSFMTKAAQGGMAEVELGQLAQQNGQSEDVKKFGKQMVDDHSRLLPTRVRRCRPT